MKCIHCQGKMERKTAPFQVDRRGYHLSLEAVPAWVCGQCGEAYFEQHEVEKIQEVIQAIDQRAEKITASPSRMHALLNCGPNPRLDRHLRQRRLACGRSTPSLTRPNGGNAPAPGSALLVNGDRSLTGSMTNACTDRNDRRRPQDVPDDRSIASAAGVTLLEFSRAYGHGSTSSNRDAD